MPKVFQRYNYSTSTFFNSVSIWFMIFTYRRNIGFSKFSLIFIKINESNKTIFERRKTYDWYKRIYIQQNRQLNSTNIKQCLIAISIAIIV